MVDGKKSLSLPEASLHPVFFSTLFMVVCFRTKLSPVVPWGGWGVLDWAQGHSWTSYEILRPSLSIYHVHSMI